MSHACIWGSTQGSRQNFLQLVVHLCIINNLGGLANNGVVNYTCMSCMLQCKKEHYLILTISVRDDGIFCEFCSSMMAQEHKVVGDTMYWWCRLNSRAEMVVQAMQMVVQHHQ